MAQSVNLWGATYSDVPAIEVPKSGGGMASFTDVTDTTAAAADVASGKYFYTASGVRTQGTNSGGGGTSKNVQIHQSTTRANSSSLTKVNGDLTVSKTGTYDIYWSAGRSNTSTSYTWGSRLYVDGSGYGTVGSIRRRSRLLTL